MNRSGGSKWMAHLDHTLTNNNPRSRSASETLWLLICRTASDGQRKIERKKNGFNVFVLSAGNFKPIHLVVGLKCWIHYFVFNVHWLASMIHIILLLCVHVGVYPSEVHLDMATCYNIQTHTLQPPHTHNGFNDNRKRIGCASVVIVKLHILWLHRIVSAGRCPIVNISMRRSYSWS